MTITYKEIGKYEFILCHQPLPTLYTYHLYILSDCLRYEINSITNSKGFVISKHTYQMSIPDIFLKWDKKISSAGINFFKISYNPNNISLATYSNSNIGPRNIA